MRLARVLALTALALWPAFPLVAWQQEQPRRHFEQQTYMIPARDGVKLYTVVLRPARAAGPLPFLITRTPYGAGRAAKGLSENKNLPDDQYLFVYQDLRGRFRESFGTPKPLKPNQAYEYTIDIHSAHHAFRKGHRMMVQVQSTWFPLIDRNPQRFVPNIFEAKAADYRKAAQSVFRSRRQPSYLELPVLAR